MDNAIKTILVSAASIINLWLVFLLITGLYSQSAQWDLDVFMWLWRLGAPVLLLLFIILIIFHYQFSFKLYLWFLKIPLNIPSNTNI